MRARRSKGSGKSGVTQQETARDSGDGSPGAVKSKATSDREKLSVVAQPIVAAYGDSRARELSPEQRNEAVAAETRVQRMELIHDWMVRGWYQKGRTDKVLAALWGVARSTVWAYSSDAVAVLRRELTAKTREELLAELLTRIQAIGQSSLERTEEVVTVQGEVVEVRRPDHRTALRAAEATGELLGLKVQRHQHTVTAQQLTTEQIVEQLRAQGVAIQLPSLVESTGTEATEPAEPAESEE